MSEEYVLKLLKENGEFYEKGEGMFSPNGENVSVVRGERMHESH